MSRTSKRMLQTCTDMPDFIPRVPIPLQIRRIIYENYNDEETRFNNDDLFAALRRGGDVDPNWIVDDLEPAITELCDSGVTRNIAQNFTTIWLKLFARLEETRCNACNSDVFLGALEERTCPGCGSIL